MIGNVEWNLSRFYINNPQDNLVGNLESAIDLVREPRIFKVNSC